MREAGRSVEAVELYRSVALAYRDQGRTQQAIAVCRSILEIAPDDLRCQALLAALAGHAPTRPSSHDETPLPGPLPYHVADPTTRSHKKLSEAALPMAEGVETRPGSEDGTRPEVGGIANAARRISAELIASREDRRDGGSYDSLDLSAELETRQRPRIESSELRAISGPPPTADFDDAPTAPPPVLAQSLGIPSADADTEEELTRPIELPAPPQVQATRQATRPSLPNVTGGSSTGALLSSAFFAPLPPARRGAVLGRFQRRSVPAGSTVIRQGESDHALVIVGRGRLEVRGECEGQTIVITGVGTGEYIGEVGLLGRIPSPAHVIAALDCELLVLPPRDFYEIAGAFPALWAELKGVAERRTRELQAKLRR
jgi:hypothetical protein